MLKMNGDAQVEQVVHILEKTVSIDQSELRNAQNFLEQAAQENLPEFLKTLSGVLHQEENSKVARMAAGLLLKNHLVAKDSSTKSSYQERWKTFPEETRSCIKNNILNSLGMEQSRPSSAAQCVAYVAVIEIPINQWPTVIPSLTDNVLQPNNSDSLKVASLDTIGFICQDIEAQILTPHANNILTAVIHGMQSSEVCVRLAAANALLNSLSFTEGNFHNEAERNFIMQVVCETTQSEDVRVKVAAFQCLVKIVSSFYQYMEHYMNLGLFPITIEAMKSEVEDVALQGIEFWSNVAEMEISLKEEEEEEALASESRQFPPVTSKFFAKGALEYIVPVILSIMSKKEDSDHEEDEWNPCKAAGVCLTLLAKCCEECIVPHILSFIEQNIRSTDWRLREAAIMAFGSCLDGLCSTPLQTIVMPLIPTLIESMYDRSYVIRVATAWTFSLVCKKVPETVLSEEHLTPVLDAFISGLKSDPRVAANVCLAFPGLAEECYEQAFESTNESDEPETYRLSPYFERIVLQLLQTTVRPDGAKANLRSAAYEALMELIKNSPLDCYSVVQTATSVILERLNDTLSLERKLQVGDGSSESAQLDDHLSLLCNTLQNVLAKVTFEDASNISEPIMQTLLQIFESHSCKSGYVQEDALMAVGALVEALGKDFKKYMPAFKPYLCLGLTTREPHEVCCASVGLTGDIVRNLKEEAIPYCDELVTILMDLLADADIHRSVKPEILTVFSELALGIGIEFKKYLDPVLRTLQQFSLLKNENNLDNDLCYWMNEMRKGIMEAYSGIIQGLRSHEDGADSNLALLDSTLPQIIQFIASIAAERSKWEALIKPLAGLIGDVCSAFGPKIASTLNTSPVRKILSKGCISTNRRTRKVSLWALKTMESAAQLSSCGESPTFQNSDMEWE